MHKQEMFITDVLFIVDVRMGRMKSPGSASLWKLKQRDFPQLLAIKPSSLLIFMWPLAGGKRSSLAQAESWRSRSHKVLPTLDLQISFPCLWQKLNEENSSRKYLLKEAGLDLNRSCQLPNIPSHVEQSLLKCTHTQGGGG